MRFLTVVVVLVGVLALIGCSGPDEDNGGHSNVVEPDAGHDEDAGGDRDEDVGGDGDGTCEPITECGANECGMIDDGCGGTLECDECRCVDGVAQEEACGVCDLGIIVCGSAETGLGVCEAPEIPGAERCSDLVFVDQREGSDTAPGTKDDPVSTLANGVDLAKSNSAVGIVLAGRETLTYAGPVLIDSRISLIGGYDSEWNRNEERPKIESHEGVDGLGDGDVVGISIQGVGQSIAIENIEVITGDATSESATNYGIHIYDSPGVEIRNVQAIAGRGGAGAHGEPGEPGSPGGAGGSATEYVRTWDDAEVGEGGVNPDCPEANGGAGGRGGRHSGFEAEDGESAEDANGGAGGENQAGADTQGGDGENGPVITVRVNGLGGTSTGDVVDGRWIPQGDGGAGDDGATGSGGGGGGGGGKTSQNFTDGSFGGGGGAGGCGGGGGAGGTGGGGSFGLFVVSGDIVAESSHFISDLGGRGGNGGLGASGGSAASGGAPSFGFEGVEYEYKGGNGGNGAVGGNGGYGGGGAGGVSYGAYCVSAEISTIGTVRFSGGGAAAGGESPEIMGEAGASGDAYQCD